MSNYLYPTSKDRHLRIIKLIDLGKEAELIISLIHAVSNKTYFVSPTSDEFNDFSRVYHFDGLWVMYMISEFGSHGFEECFGKLKDSHPNANIKFREFMRKLDEVVPMACPITGEFYGYKKAYYLDYQKKEARDCIIKLQIPNDAKRSSSFGRKCRCSKAKVISIRTINGEDVLLETARSNYNHNFKYKLSEWVVPEYDFDENRWNECASGIHFFMTEEEAMDY